MLDRDVIFRTLSLIICFSAAFPAIAQNASVAEELERLRRDMNTIQSYIFKGDKRRDQLSTGTMPEFASQESVSQLQLQAQELRRQMREMNGQFEQIQFKISQIAERLAHAFCE